MVVGKTVASPLQPDYFLPAGVDYTAKYIQVTWSADTGGISPHKGDEEDLYTHGRK